MNAHIRLGRLWGTAIGLHYSWFLIALLLVFSVASHFHAAMPRWSTLVVWTSALVTAVLFFAMLIAHELAHTLIARSRGLPVESITLFALGGVAEIRRDAADARTEFWMGLAGPIASVLLGAGCLALARALGSVLTPPQAVLMWLGYINLWLAAFNMIPGFPLDGGRILRAILWWATKDAARATKAAARAGQGIALAFITIGLLRFVTGIGFGGLWLALIGWFLLEAAQASYAQAHLGTTLVDVRVEDVMSRDCPSIERGATLQAFADHALLRAGRRCFAVRDHGEVAGLITPKDVAKIERTRWPWTRVDTVMHPLQSLPAVTPDMPLTRALDAMRQQQTSQVPVLSPEGHFVGIVSHNHVLQLLEARAELQP